MLSKAVEDHTLSVSLSTEFQMSPIGHSGADFDRHPEVVLPCCGRLICATVRMVVEVKRRLLSVDGVAPLMCAV